jgi:flagellar hook-associated protein 3 FlgL
MIRTYSASTEIFLTNLNLIKQRASEDAKQLSSGHAVSEASDSPADVVSLLQVRNNLAQLGQVTGNLTRLKTEVDSGESALETAVSLLQNANVLGAQALGVGLTPETLKALAVQVQNLQQQMVGLSQTNATGHFVFSGDSDLQPQYTMSPTMPATVDPLTGVYQNFAAQDTQQITDVVGGTFAASGTAQDIFDQRDASNSPTANNVFASLQQLSTGLMNNDSSAISLAIGNIKTAGVYLNNQLAFYGSVQNRISSSMTIATKYQTQYTQQISAIRDTDVAGVASDLQACQTQEQAALSAQANFSPKSLFDYLR